MRVTITLVGFSGCGKSTLGALLARKKRAPFFDTDVLVAQRSGRAIPEMLRQGRERRFRQLEWEVIRNLYRTTVSPKVVALGGGAFVEERNRRVVCEAGPVVYLSCSVRELYRRLRHVTDRPLLADVADGRGAKSELLSRISGMLAARRAAYERADYRLSVTARSVRESLEDLMRIVEEIHANCAR